MSDKENVYRMGFNEALKKIADTPKASISKKNKEVDDLKNNEYNVEIEATKKPPQPAKRRS